MRPARLVTAEPLRRPACQPQARAIEAGVRPTRGIDDEVIALRADAWVAPRRALAVRVLRVRQADGSGVQRLGRGARPEEHLHQLPVALVHVDEVVEVVEEPVLQGDQAGAVGLLRDVHVGGGIARRHTHAPLPCLLLVEAARAQRVAGEVERVLLTQAVDVAARGGMAHHPPVLLKGDVGVAEQRVHRARPEGLTAGVARTLLGLEQHDGRIALGQLPGGGVGSRRGGGRGGKPRRGKQQHGEQPHEGPKAWHPMRLRRRYSGGARVEPLAHLARRHADVGDVVTPLQIAH